MLILWTFFLTFENVHTIALSESVRLGTTKMIFQLRIILHYLKSPNISDI